MDFLLELFTRLIKSILISFKTISEILFKSLVGVLGVPGTRVGEISSARFLFTDAFDMNNDV